MIPEQHLRKIVQRAQSAAGANLQCVVLYGSGAGDDFDPEFSDINLLFVLGDTSLASLQALGPVVQAWVRSGQPAPLLMTRQEMERSSDVFAIEFLDMKQRYRVLLGEDPLAQLEVPLDLHRSQLEYELREKLILLRNALLMTDKKNLWTLLLHSWPAFATLMRHSLIAFGETPPSSKREAVERLARRIQFNPAPFQQLMDVREHKQDRKQLDAHELCARYLEAIEQVTAGVDRLLESAGGSPNQ